MIEVGQVVRVKGILGPNMVVDEVMPAMPPNYPDDAVEAFWFTTDMLRVSSTFKVDFLEVVDLKGAKVTHFGRSPNPASRMGE